MMVQLMEAMALAIYAYEGSRPPDRAYRNNNPGNLRASAKDFIVDDGGYREFASFQDGFKALCADILAKVSGANPHGLGPDSTLLDFFRVYAPSKDNNHPVKYALFVADWLHETFQPLWCGKDTSFKEILNQIGQELPGGEHTT